MTHLGDDDATGYATVDLVTGATSPLPAPPQCDHLQYHASGHGGLGFLCGSLFDRQTLLVHGFGTGAWSTLPVPEEAYGAADDDAFLFQVGRYWLGFRTHGYHYRNNTTYISRSGSGATLRFPLLMFGLGGPDHDLSEDLGELVLERPALPVRPLRHAIRSV